MKNKKSLGQHWLKNRKILDQIADLAKVDDALVCVEIGPGLGTLTSSLLRRFTQVIAVEFDSDLARKLPGSFPGKNLVVENADILQVNLRDLLLKNSSSDDAKYVVVGNIPYYITTPIVSKLLENTNPKPEKIVLLMQKEVAERLAADAGDYGYFSLVAQNLAEIELGPVVKAEEFTPPPKVDSQVLVLTPYDKPQIDPKCLELAKIGFSSPRKKLVANLAAGTDKGKEFWRNALEKNAINPDARAQDLSLWDWEALFGENGE